MPVEDTSNYAPYAPNSQSLTEVLIDLKDTIAVLPDFPGIANFKATVAVDVVQGNAVYMNLAGQVQPATNNTTVDEATVIGFAKQSRTAGQTVDVLIAGVLASSGLLPGRTYFLGLNGAITTTAPTNAGDYITRIGEAASTGELIVQIEPPVLLT